MTAETTPIRLHLKKDEKLEIDWKDGRKSVYTLSLLRSMCPCAQCKTTRATKSLLTILPGNYSGNLTAVAAEMVGNYAIRIDWSDDHGSGIYSFEYLREMGEDEQTSVSRTLAAIWSPACTCGASSIGKILDTSGVSWRCTLR